MEDLKMFFKENKVKNDIVEVTPTDSLKDNEGKPLVWKIRPLKSKEMDKLKDECIKISKNGRKVETDMAKLSIKVAVACTVFPELSNKELQDSYGVMNAEDLIIELLDKAGEYDAYAKKILDISGYNKTMEELVEEAKN